MAADEAQSSSPESEFADQASFVSHDLCDSAVQSSVETSVDANHGTAGKWRRIRFVQEKRRTGGAIGGDSGGTKVG